jgi:cardiolipin synthase
VWTIANLLTLFRILLIAPFLICIQRNRPGVALAVFAVASVTDFFDGYLARNFGQQSRLGRFLDPAADKLLTTASFIVLALPREDFPSIPLWLTASVVTRDLLIITGSLVIYLVTRFTQFKPSMMGKVNTTIEMCFIVVFLSLHTFGVAISLLPLCYVIVFASVVLSGGGYVVEGIRILRNHRKARHAAVPVSGGN